MLISGITGKKDKTPYFLFAFKPIYDFRRHSTDQYSLLFVVPQALAASRICTGTAAAMAFPLGVFLYAYILRHCG